PTLSGKRRQTARVRRRGVPCVRRLHCRAPSRPVWLYDFLVPTTATGVRGAGSARVLLLVCARDRQLRRFSGALEAVALAVVCPVRGGRRRTLLAVRPADRGAAGVVDRRVADGVAGGEPDARYPRAGPEPGRRGPFPA